MFGWWQRRRRNRIRAREFPPAWRGLVQRNVPLFGRLSPNDQAELLGHILVFLQEKRFEGAGGLEITDEIRVTIAAQACMLLLHRPDDYFPELVTIIVYPATFVTPRKTVENGLVTEGHSVALGQSWTRGNVVLAWDAALGGGRDLRDGHNVVLHEFAHQLDQEDGTADGAPPLPARGMYGPWARVLGAEFERLQQGAASVLDRYGATNPAEFFAVATEAFFEKPHQLKKKHPELYDQLAGYFRQDPAAWAPAQAG